MFLGGIARILRITPRAAVNCGAMGPWNKWEDPRFAGGTVYAVKAHCAAIDCEHGVTKFHPPVIPPSSFCVFSPPTGTEPEPPSFQSDLGIGESSAAPPVRHRLGEKATAGIASMRLASRMRR